MDTGQFDEVHTFDHTSEEGWGTAEDAMKHMALDIEGVCEGRGWQGEDEFHNTFLGAVFIQIDVPEDDPDGVTVSSEVCWVSPLPLPGFVLTDLAYYLPQVAATAEMGMTIWRQSWAENCAPVACVATFEGWTLDTPAEEMTERQKEFWRRGEAHLLEERIEERCVMIYLYDGTAIVVYRRRDQEPSVTIIPRNDEKTRMKGRIPDSMRALTKTVTGVLWEGDD